MEDSILTGNKLCSIDNLDSLQEPLPPVQNQFDRRMKAYGLSENSKKFSSLNTLNALETQRENKPQRPFEPICSSILKTKETNPSASVVSFGPRTPSRNTQVSFKIRPHVHERPGAKERPFFPSINDLSSLKERNKLGNDLFSSFSLFKTGPETKPNLQKDNFGSHTAISLIKVMENENLVQRRPKDKAKIKQLHTEKSIENIILEDFNRMEETRIKTEFVSQITQERGFKGARASLLLNETQRGKPATIKNLNLSVLDPSAANISTLALPESMDEVEEVLLEEKFPVPSLNGLTFEEEKSSLKGMAQSKAKIKLKKAAFASSSRLQKFKTTAFLPAGRKEVAELAEWFSKMKERTSASFKEELSQQVLIHCFAMREVIRQTKISFMERGELLQEIWESWTGLSEAVFSQIDPILKEKESQLNAKVQKAEEEFKKEKSRLAEGILNIRREFELRCDLVKELENELSITTGRLNSARYQLRNIREENRNLVEREIMAQKVNFAHEEFINSMKNEVFETSQSAPNAILTVMRLWEQNEQRLKRKIVRIEENSEKEESESKKLQEKKEQAEMAMVLESEQLHREKLVRAVKEMRMNDIDQEGNVVGTNKAEERLKQIMEVGAEYADKAVDTKSLWYGYNKSTETDPEMIKEHTDLEQKDHEESKNSGEKSSDSQSCPNEHAQQLNNLESLIQNEEAPIEIANNSPENQFSIIKLHEVPQNPIKFPETSPSKPEASPSPTFSFNFKVADETGLVTESVKIQRESPQKKSPFVLTEKLQMNQGRVEEVSSPEILIKGPSNSRNNKKEVVLLCKKAKMYQKFSTQLHGELEKTTRILLQRGNIEENLKIEITEKNMELEKMKREIEKKEEAFQRTFSLLEERKKRESILSKNESNFSKDSLCSSISSEIEIDSDCSIISQVDCNEEEGNKSYLRGSRKTKTQNFDISVPKSDTNLGRNGSMIIQNEAMRRPSFLSLLAPELTVYGNCEKTEGSRPPSSRLMSGRSRGDGSHSNSFMDPKNNFDQLDKERKHRAREKTLKIAYNQQAARASDILHEFLVNDGWDSAKKEAKNIKLISKKSLLSYISAIYKDHLSHMDFGTHEMFVAAYKFLLSKYSLPKTVSKKYKEILKSAYFYSDDPRIKTFCGFLGIKGIYDQNTQNNFMILLQNFVERQVDIFHKIASPCPFIVSFSFTIEGTRKVFKDFDPQVVEKLKEKLEKMKVSDGRTKMAHFVDFDEAMETILHHSLLNNNFGNPFDEVFFAADINGDGMLEFEEFVRITRHCESSFYKENWFRMQAIFNRFSNEQAEERVMNLEMFRRLCSEMGLYSQESKEAFFKKARMASGIKELMKNWDSVQVALKKSLIEADSYHYEFKLFIESLEKHIKNYEDVHAGKIWFNYTILEKETERLSNLNALQAFIPQELLCFLD